MVSQVYHANVDPLPILDITDLMMELRRRGIMLPERGPWDTDNIYRDMLQEVHLLLIYLIECFSVKINLNINQSRI